MGPRSEMLFHLRLRRIMAVFFFRVLFRELVDDSQFFIGDL